MNGIGKVKQMCDKCCCCWHYSPLQQKCTYWGAGDNCRVNANDNCHFPEKDAFNNVCEFENEDDE